MRHTVGAKNSAGVACLFIGDRQKKMFGRDVLVFHLFGDLQHVLEDRVRTRTEVLLAAGNLRKFFDGRLKLGDNSCGICSDLSEDRSKNAFLLVEHRLKNMLRLNLLILVLFSYTDGFLHGLLAADGKPIESHNFILLQRSVRRRATFNVRPCVSLSSVSDQIRLSPRRFLCRPRSF